MTLWNLGYLQCNLISQKFWLDHNYCKIRKKLNHTTEFHYQPPFYKTLMIWECRKNLKLFWNLPTYLEKDQEDTQFHKFLSKFRVYLKVHLTIVMMMIRITSEMRTIIMNIGIDLKTILRQILRKILHLNQIPSVIAHICRFYYG